MKTRELAEPNTEVTHSKEELKKIVLEKMQLEQELNETLASQTHTNKMMATQKMMVEKTRIMDKLYVKYNIKLVEINKGTELYKLEEDEDIKTLKASTMEKTKASAEAAKKALQMTDDQKAKLTEYVAEAGGRIEEMSSEKGIYPYETFMKIVRVQAKCLRNFTEEKYGDFDKDRRALLKAGEEAKYKEMLQMQLAKKNALRDDIRA